MQHHRNVPQVFVDVGKSYLDVVQPSLSYQGHTSLKASLNALASCARHLEVRVGPKSSNPYFGLPCILIHCPPPLCQSMMDFLPLLLLRLSR